MNSPDDHGFLARAVQGNIDTQIDQEKRIVQNEMEIKSMKESIEALKKGKADKSALIEAAKAHGTKAVLTAGTAVFLAWVSGVFVVIKELLRKWLGI